MIYRFGDGYQMRWDDQEQDWIYEPVPPPEYFVFTSRNTTSRNISPFNEYMNCPYCGSFQIYHHTGGYHCNDCGRNWH